LKDGTVSTNYLSKDIFFRCYKRKLTFNRFKVLLERLLRVRQACDHSLLVFVPPASEKNVKLNFKEMQEKLDAVLKVVIPQRCPSALY
jgi:hypothetical protein